MSFSEIAALTIHDVKNQLGQLAADAELRGDIRSVRIALQASENLSRLLCFYKSETHILDVQIEAQSPTETIDDLLQALPRTMQESQKIQIKTDLSQAPALWFYDKTLIHMVLANALQNALRFAHSQITLSVSEKDAQLEFCVEDDGEGFPSPLLEEVSASSPVTTSGTGLGLLLARSVVTLHSNLGRSGKIQLTNSHGAQFRLILP